MKYLYLLYNFHLWEKPREARVSRCGVPCCSGPSAAAAARQSDRISGQVQSDANDCGITGSLGGITHLGSAGKHRRKNESLNKEERLNPRRLKCPFRKGLRSPAQLASTVIKKLGALINEAQLLSVSRHSSPSFRGLRGDEDREKGTETIIEL